MFNALVSTDNDRLIGYSPVQFGNGGPLGLLIAKKLSMRGGLV
jgi:hypothetical protein